MASVDQSSVHENGRTCAKEEGESESEQESESSESSEDEDGPTVALVDQSPVRSIVSSGVWRCLRIMDIYAQTSADFATRPCIPLGTDPSVAFRVRSRVCVYLYYSGFTEL